METFVDVTRRPVSQIDIAVGETKILGLKKFNLGIPPSVVVFIQNPEIAFCFQVVHLKDTSKKSYNDLFAISRFSDQFVPVERGDLFFFQICGKAAGQIELIANHHATGPPYAPYAQPVSITVKPNLKRLYLPAAKNNSVPDFNTLWQNHPLNPIHRVDYPCNQGGPPLGHMQCMVRLCVALEKSGVSFAGIFGTSCKLKGANHARHFSHPYEFETWPWAKGRCYVWKTSPDSPEPMPGLAAFWFVRQKQGIILFKHYFDVPGQKTKMFGGHIDLWNKVTMGNTYDYGTANNPINPMEGLSLIHI